MRSVDCVRAVEEKMQANTYTKYRELYRPFIRQVVVLFKFALVPFKIVSY